MVATLTKPNLVNPLTCEDQGFLNDPYPTLRKLREEAPIYWSERDKYWLISKYSDVQTIIRDDRFGKQIHTWKYAPGGPLANLIPGIRTLRRVAANWLLNLNPPAHTRVRSLVNQAFTRVRMNELSNQIEALAASTLNSLPKNGQTFDFISDFAVPYPLGVIAIILGIPVEDKASLRAWANQVTGLIGGQNKPPQLIKAGQAMSKFAKYLGPHIEERRSGARADLLGELVKAQEQEDKLSVDELIGTAILILVAGFETTTHFLGNMLYCTSKFEALWSEAEKSPALIDKFAQEVLRFESPAQTVPRLALVDYNLGDKTIRKGDMVWLLLGSAHRDPAQFTQPDNFDPYRAESKLLAFGEGAHRCLGAHLAQLEVATAFKQMLESQTTFSIVETPSFRAPFGLRGMKRILVQRG
jgi:pimeloyl-[acyl-carrier protein] synthase